MLIEQIRKQSVRSIRCNKVAAYARVSCGKDQHLKSANAQVDYYKKKIKRNPAWIFKGVFSDEDRTGTKTKREGFDELLTLCRKGEVDLVLTKSISRFARNTLDLLNIIRELKDLGVAVEFEQEGINTLTADGELMISLIAAIAQEESLSASENMKWAIRKGYEQGSLKQVRRTYGYLVKLGEVSIVPSEAVVVQEIFERYVRGELPSVIVKDLNRRGIRTLEGAIWRTNRLNQIVSNVFYTGNTLLQKLYVPNHLDKKQVKNKGELPQYYIENSHEPIVSMDVFQKVQEIKAQRRYKKKPDTKHVFSGKIICGICGANFNRKHDRGKHKWQCCTYRRDGVKGCNSKQIPEETLQKVSATLLGLSSFDESAFELKVESVKALNGNRLLFHMRDGTVLEEHWSDRSRSESWTLEMRKEAGKKTKERHINQNG